MRSKSVLFALWMLVTVVAATVAWQSLGLVGASIDGGQDIAASTLPTLADSVASSTTLAPAVTGPVTDPVTAGGISTTTSTTTSSEISSAPSAPQSTSTTEAAIVQLIRTEGGQAQISFSPTKVEMVWASAASGYEARSEVEKDGVKVEFRGGHERYRIDAWWDGEPRYTVSEEDHDD